MALNGSSNSLIETCFVDSLADKDLYDNYFEDVCVAIAETISGREVSDIRPPHPELPERPELSEENRVDIIGSTRGEVTVIINR